MRLLTSGLVAAGLLTSHVAGAVCVSPADREALDVVGLKNQLMVQTLTCKNDDEYNAFINKFKPELAADERVANTYFTHAYGRGGQKRYDEFKTSSANASADTSQKDGSRFCGHNQEIFNEVLALKSGSELKEFAAGRIGGQPASFDTCSETTAPTRSSRAPTTHRRKK